jgi:hypothetical protein
MKILTAEPPRTLRYAEIFLGFEILISKIFRTSLRNSAPSVVKKNSNENASKSMGVST